MSDALPEALLARLRLELAEVDGVWLAPALAGVELASHTRLVTPPAHADVAVVLATQLSEHGEVDASIEGPVKRALAVMRFGGGVCIHARLPAPGTRVARIISELAVIDVEPEGLVIVELAKGVSAADLQQHAEPTLKISPWVAEMP